MAALRLLGVLVVLALGFALGLYYTGGTQWLYDRYGYSPVPYQPPAPVVETPVPAPGPQPVTSYPTASSDTPTPAPGVIPETTPVASLPPYPNEDAQSDDEGGDDGDEPAEDEADDQHESEYGAPSAEPTYTPPGPTPPVGVTPVGNGPPLSLEVTIGHRGDGAGCERAYTVFNDTSRPIMLTERERHHRRGADDAPIVQPSERYVACAADVYDTRDGEPHYDYYRQNVHYGPDAIDLPPPVDIRVKE